MEENETKIMCFMKMSKRNVVGVITELIPSKAAIKTVLQNIPLCLLLALHIGIFAVIVISLPIGVSILIEKIMPGCGILGLLSSIISISIAFAYADCYMTPVIRKLKMAGLYTIQYLQ